MSEIDTTSGAAAPSGGAEAGAAAEANGATTAPTYEDIRAAASRIRPYVHRTPVMTCRRLDELTGRKLFFKCENLQRIGAFKIRGATNAIRQLPDDVAQRGVVTHSSGNHAQAIALAAATRGIPAHIVMPTSAPDVKRRAVIGYGGRVIDCEPNLEARETTAARVLEETGGTLIHPYDDPRIIAGQGTMALELLEDAGEPLDALVAPVGGGGMMSGCCIAARGAAPDIRLFAAEPAGADDAARSLAGDRLVPQTGPDTIADGLLTSLGDHTWPILRSHLEAILTVDDATIVEAMRWVFEAMKLVVEPSGATGLAAVLAALRGDAGVARRPGTNAATGDANDSDPLAGAERIGIVLCGGNVDLDRLPWMTTARA